MASDLKAWEEPWVRDFRGTNRALLDPVDRGLAPAKARVQNSNPAPVRIPTHHQQIAENLVARKEADEAKIAPRQERDALSNAARIRPLLPFISAPNRGDVPLRLVLGWIDKESSGRLGLQMQNDLDEISLFQISREERSKYLGLGDEARSRILSDPRFSMEQGMRLARFYQRYLQKEFGISDASPARWELVKLMHKSGLPTVNHLLRNMVGSDLTPRTSSWRDIKLFLATHPQKGLSLESMSKVDEVMFRGAVLEQYFASH